MMIIKEILNKTYVSFPKSFSNEQIPLKKIYIIKRGHNFKITNLKTQEAFIELVRNTFGIELFSKSELPNNFFQCKKIVNNVNISILEIPESLKRYSKSRKNCRKRL